MRPETLYKYEPLTPQTLRNLKGQVLYFGTPLNFNDPYDCAFMPNIQEPTEHDLAEIKQALLKEPDLPSKTLAELETFSNEQLKKNLMGASIGALQHEIDRFLNQRGVSCFSESNDNLIMWSHYADSHRGICLEFKSSSEALEKIQKVKYVPHPPQIKIKTMLVDRDFNVVRELFCTKSESWAYENEWRAIHQKAGTEFIYSAKDLSAVYFGPEVNSLDLEIVCLILQGQNENVSFWKGQRSQSEFKLEFNKITYTPYITAQKLGLIEERLRQR